MVAVTTLPPTVRFSSVRSASGGDAAVVEHEDVVGESVGLLQVLGGQHDGRAIGGEPVDDGPERGAGHRVEAGGRFVEEQDRGRPDEACGQVDPPPRSSRHLTDPLSGEMVQPELLDQLAGSAPRSVGATRRGGRPVPGSRGR